MAKVIFSDETIISQMECSQSYIRRPKNARYDAKYVLPKVRNQVKVMIWVELALMAVADCRVGIRNTDSFHYKCAFYMFILLLCIFLCIAIKIQIDFFYA